MAAQAGNAGNFTPWFETLKGIAKNATKNNPSSPGVRSPCFSPSFEALSPAAGRSKRISPTHDDPPAAKSLSALTTLEEPPRSSFSFAENNLQILPVSNSPPRSPPSKNSPPKAPLQMESKAVSAPAPVPVSNYSKDIKYPTAKNFDHTYGRSYDWKVENAQEPPKSSRCKICCYWFVATSILLFIILAITVSIMAAKLNPRRPTVLVSNINLTRFDYTEGSSGVGPKITAGMSFLLNVTNPNKHAMLIYNDLITTLYFNNQGLGNIVIPGFDQAKMSETVLNGDLPETVTTIQSGEVTDPVIQIELRGAATGKYKVFNFKVRSFNIPIDCKLTVRTGGSQQAQLESNSCYYSAS